MPSPEPVTIERPDDEVIEIYVGGTLVACANHDEHGWSGMDAVEATAVAVERAFRVELERVTAERDAALAAGRRQAFVDLIGVRTADGRIYDPRDVQLMYPAEEVNHGD